MISPEITKVTESSKKANANGAVSTEMNGAGIRGKAVKIQLNAAPIGIVPNVAARIRLLALTRLALLTRRGTMAVRGD